LGFGGLGSWPRHILGGDCGRPRKGIKIFGKEEENKTKGPWVKKNRLCGEAPWGGAPP